MAKRGRKNKYYTHVEPNLMKILEMCKTLTEQQIAEELGVGYSTFMEYKKQFPELAEILKKGRQNLVGELRSTLIKKAKGYEFIETKEVTEYVKLPQGMVDALIEAGFDKKQLEDVHVVKTEVSHKQSHPDVAALNLLLKNYDKEKWANDPQMLDIRKKELKLREKQIEENSW